MQPFASGFGTFSLSGMTAKTNKSKSVGLTLVLVIIMMIVMTVQVSL
jgi:hypothetical protein